MEQLHRDDTDKLKADIRHLEIALDRGDMDLALSAAKRARKHATMSVRHIAEQRNKL